MNNPFLLSLRSQYAFVALNILNVFGDYCAYSDRSETPSTLYMGIGEEDRELAAVLNLQAEQTARNFYIPLQLDGSGNQIFPPANDPSNTAQITYDGDTWSVKKWHRDALGVLYTADAVRTQPRRLL